jgi:hypothetical protein
MKHITIIVPYESFAVADIATLMGAQNINILDIEAEPFGAKGLIILQVDRYDDALKALREAGFDAVPEEAMLVKVPDAPGALAKIASRFKEHGIMMRSLRIVRREGGECFVAIQADRTPEALELLKDVLVS